MKFPLLIIASIFYGVLASSAVVAADYDGSKPLLCAPTDTSECVAGEGCARGEAANVNLPDFIRVTVADKLVATIDNERSTPILNVADDADSLILQGNEAGRAWSMTISKVTGRMTLSAATSGKAFVVFGSCTAL